MTKHGSCQVGYPNEQTISEPVGISQSAIRCRNAMSALGPDSPVSDLNVEWFDQSLPLPLRLGFSNP
jgi:hypothetical protein